MIKRNIFLDDREWLHQKYVVERITKSEIIRITNCTRKYLDDKIKEYGFPKLTLADSRRRKLFPPEVVKRLENPDYLYDLRVTQDLALSKISEIVGVKVPVLKRQLESFGIPIGDDRDRKVSDDSRHKLNDFEWLHEQYVVNKLSMESIAHILITTKETVKISLLKAGIKPLTLAETMRKNISHEAITSVEDKDWLYDQYYNKRLSISALGRKFNVSRGFIKKQLAKFEIPLIAHIDQVQKEIPRDSLQKLNDYNWMHDQYIDQDKSMSDIAKMLDSRRELVKLRLKQLNIPSKGVAHEARKHYPANTLGFLEDKEWLEHQNHELKVPISEIANDLGVSGTSVGRSFRQFEIKVYSSCVSQPEKEINEMLVAHGYNTVTNCRNIIKPLELDIYLSEKKIGIEFNGLFWHSDAIKNKDYHKRKYDMSIKAGIRLIQVYEDDWMQRKDIVIKKILNILGNDTNGRVFARKTSIIRVNTSTKSEFFNKNHIQGNGASSLNYGLVNNGELVACIGFIRNNDEVFTLNRYATSCPVIGGFTKLLKHFELQYNKPKIITFADLSWSNGDLYTKSGFTFEKKLPPDYAWLVRNPKYNSLERQHKFNFRHKRLKKILANYDPNLSETENMHNHGFHKIYDAGKLRFVKNG